MVVCCALINNKTQHRHNKCVIVQFNPSRELQLIYLYNVVDTIVRSKLLQYDFWPLGNHSHLLILFIFIKKYESCLNIVFSITNIFQSYYPH